MSELIDIWRAIELLNDKRSYCNFFVDGQTAYEALSDMINAVKELPRIDLVRCGECKYWHEECKYWHEGRCWNIKGLNKTDGVVNADDFCSYGERRADDSNT